jgi:hypothetical protein
VVELPPLVAREGMVAAVAEEADDPKKGRPANEFPGASFPNAFADGVSSYARGAGFVKFYLYRTDPNSFGRGGSVANPFAQIVMPTEGFAAAVVLFQRALREIMKEGIISQEDLDKMDAAITSVNPPTAPSP